MLRNLTEREEKKKLSGGEDFEPNSFVEINTFVKQEVFDAHK
jgi:hypothetical protein